MTQVRFYHRRYVQERIRAGIFLSHDQFRVQRAGDLGTLQIVSYRNPFGLPRLT